MRILVAEDEHRIAEALRKGLEQEHYAVDVVYTGTDGYDMASSESYDLIILDLLLPGMDGLEVCRQLRHDGVHIPILMLTARSQIEDKVKGLDTGADDYLTKPFAFTELLARIRALVRRPSQDLGTKLTAGAVEMDTTALTVKHKGELIKLSNREYALLEYLLRHPGVILTKEQIIAHVWSYEADILPNTVEVYIRKLRHKLGAQAILTIRGFGYKLG